MKGIDPPFRGINKVSGAAALLLKMDSTMKSPGVSRFQTPKVSAQQPPLFQKASFTPSKSKSMGVTFVAKIGTVEPFGRRMRRRLESSA